MYIAVDIGGTKTLIAVFDEAGTIVDSLKFKTQTDYDAYMAELIQNIKTLAGDKEIKVISVAVPGHVEDDTGIVKGFGNLDWKNKDIISALSPSFEAPIILDNDANLGGLGEATMGAGQGKRKVLYVTMSTGIGTGVTIDGKIDPAMKESEGGQIILEHDDKLMPWEKFGSGKAFYEHYHQYADDVEDPEIWKEFVENIAQGLWDLSALVQPDVIVIGGSMGMNFHKYGEFLNQAIQAYESPVIDNPPIVQAKFPNDAVINGCYQAAKQYVESA